jgi:hypothetical protein
VSPSVKGNDTINMVDELVEVASLEESLHAFATRFFIVCEENEWFTGMAFNDVQNTSNTTAVITAEDTVGICNDSVLGAQDEGFIHRGVSSCIHMRLQKHRTYGISCRNTEDEVLVVSVYFVPRVGTRQSTNDVLYYLRIRHAKDCLESLNAH